VSDMECGIVDSFLTMWFSHVMMVIVSAVVSAGFMWWFLMRSRKRDQLMFQPGVRNRLRR